MIITANGRDAINYWFISFLCSLIHNLAGYTLGYWGCKLLRLNEKIVGRLLEVGMQNGGLASGIAVELGRVSTLGLAPLFLTWNVSGLYC